MEGKATQQQIDDWKAKYDEIYEAVSLINDKQHATYLRKPDLDVISAAAKYAESDPVKSGIIMLNSIRIGGSDAPMNNDEAKMGLMAYAGKLFKVIEAEGKKL